MRAHLGGDSKVADRPDPPAGLAKDAELRAVLDDVVRLPSCLDTLRWLVANCEERLSIPTVVALLEAPVDGNVHARNPARRAVVLEWLLRFAGQPAWFRNEDPDDAARLKERDRLAADWSALRTRVLEVQRRGRGLRDVGVTTGERAGEEEKGAACATEKAAAGAAVAAVAAHPTKDEASALTPVAAVVEPDLCMDHGSQKEPPWWPMTGVVSVLSRVVARGDASSLRVILAQYDRHFPRAGGDPLAAADARPRPRRFPLLYDRSSMRAVFTGPLSAALRKAGWVANARDDGQSSLDQDPFALCAAQLLAFRAPPFTLLTSPFPLRARPAAPQACSPVTVGAIPWILGTRACTNTAALAEWFESIDDWF